MKRVVITAIVCESAGEIPRITAHHNPALTMPYNYVPASQLSYFGTSGNDNVLSLGSDKSFYLGPPEKVSRRKCAPQ